MTLPEAVRKALYAPFMSESLEHDGDTWRGTGKLVPCPPDVEQRADRARAMAAALRWAEYEPDPGKIAAVAAALDAEATK